MNLLDADKEDITRALKQGKFKTAIVGMGVIGTYIAAEFLRAGGHVVGADIDPKIVDSINKANHISNDKELDRILREKVQAGELIATTDITAAVHDSKVICICVPTLLSNGSAVDLTKVEAAAELVSKGLAEGSVVILHSSVTIGATRNILLPILRKSGLTTQQFCLACAPERMNPGDTLEQQSNTPRIVAGIDAKSTDMAETIISATAKKVVPVTSVEVAEAVKLFENTFRDVNIALVNELAIYFERLGVDVTEVIKAASTKYNVVPHFPGAGVGGYCIPVSPRYLVHGSNPEELRIVKLAREINDNMPQHTVDLVIAALRQSGKSVAESKVAILGLSYKENLADLRWSPAIDIVRQLKAAGATLALHDPLLSDEVVQQFGLPNLSLEEAVQDSDCLVITTAHKIFKEIPLETARSSMKRSPVIVDGRNILNPSDVIKAGFRYFGIGRNLDARSSHEA